MSRLFSPIRLRELEIRNRIFLSPMCQYSATDGMPNEWHRVHYGTRAVGGAGLVMMEAAGVTPEGRITPFDLGLWSDAQIAAFEPIVSFAKSQGARVGIQLAHGGRKASTDAPWNGGKQLAVGAGGWRPLAPSALPFLEEDCVPREMSRADIDGVVELFAAAAKRALTAGFEVIEAHMAHGYLLHEFLSPHTNRRTDEYGGDFENRVRLPLRIAQTIRGLWPGKLPMFVRISATDWVDGGWDLQQSVEFARRLKSIGADLIDVSSGGLIHNAKIPVAPGFQAPFAAAIRKETGIFTSTVGVITEAEQAEQLLVQGQADAVCLGRELLRNPYWPLAAAKKLGVEISWPNQYLRAR